MDLTKIQLEDFPPGPLDEYRNKATFDWKAMKFALEGEEVSKYQVLNFVFLCVILIINICLHHFSYSDGSRTGVDLLPHCQGCDGR